jgi:hypothetical protein
METKSIRKQYYDRLVDVNTLQRSKGISRTKEYMTPREIFSTKSGKVYRKELKK